MGKNGSKMLQINKQSTAKGPIAFDSGIEAQNDDLDDVFHPPGVEVPQPNIAQPEDNATTSQIQRTKSREMQKKRKSTRGRLRPGIRNVLYLGLCGRAKKGDYSPTKEESTAPKNCNESFKVNDPDAAEPEPDHMSPKIIVHREGKLSGVNEGKPAALKEEHVASQTQNDTFQEDGFREIEITEKPEEEKVFPEKSQEPVKYGRRSDPTGLPKTDHQGEKRRSEPIMQPIQTLITVRSEPVGRSPKGADKSDQPPTLVEITTEKYSAKAEAFTVIPNHGIQYAAYLGKEACRRSDPLGLIRSVKSEDRRRSDPVGSSGGNFSNKNPCIEEEDPPEEVIDDTTAEVKQNNNVKEDQNR